MDRPVEPEVFIREFLLGFLESRLVNGLISTDEYHDKRLGLCRDGSLVDLSRQLFENAPEPVDLASYGRVRVVPLREPDGREFPFLQGLGKVDWPSKRRLVCFVGHRFLKDIERSLRFNLVHLFEPYDVSIRWSGYDLNARGILEDVVSGIKNSDLCFFDNLGTLNKPNVYIEIGIAHALGKPMLVSEYLGPGTRGRRKIPDTGSVPSNLEGLLRIPYRSYQELCRQLYFGLSVFLERHCFR